MTGFRFLEFFAGAGLVRLGLGSSWSCVWANDIDPRKQLVYEQNFGSDEFVLGDIASMKAESLPSSADMAWASFPCQDLSLAGWRGGMEAQRSGTFWAFWRIMHDLLDRGDRPPLLVIENVVGLLHGQDFTGLCEALAALDMQFGAFVIDARRFVPQSRPRVFVVAADARLDCSPHIAAGPPAGPWYPEALHRAYEALSPSLRNRWRWWRMPTPTAQVPEIQSLIEAEPTSVAWHSAEETNHLLDMMTELNRQKVATAQKIGRRAVGFLYRRVRGGYQRAEVRFDGVAGCLRTPTGGSSRQTVMIVDRQGIRSRLLSTREAARLMGVGDGFWLPSKYNDAYRAMGDGVAVPAVAWLQEHLLTPLAQACRVTPLSLRSSQLMAHHRDENRQAALARASRWEAARV